MNQEIINLNPHPASYVTIVFTWLEDKKVFVKYFRNEIEFDDVDFKVHFNVVQDAVNKWFDCESRANLIKWSY